MCNNAAAAAAAAAVVLVVVVVVVVVCIGPRDIIIITVTKCSGCYSLFLGIPKFSLSLDGGRITVCLVLLYVHKGMSVFPPVKSFEFLDILLFLQILSRMD
jgi:hypothetical protein